MAQWNKEEESYLIDLCINHNHRNLENRYEIADLFLKKFGDRNRNQIYKKIKRMNKSNVFGNNKKVIKNKDKNIVEELDSNESNYVEKLVKQNQLLKDKLRIEQSRYRSSDRTENALVQVATELKNVFKEHSLNLTSNIISESVTVKNDDYVGVLQISDTHFNELVDLDFNKYDFIIASKRLKYYITRSIIYFKSFNISKILIALTGDLINSDRRIDEIMAGATNRSKAVFLAVSILQQIIRELSSHFEVHIAAVSGNESRVREEMGFVEDVITDNYDFLIYNILKYIFENSKSERIHFIDGINFSEMVVNIGNMNVLLTHGVNIKKNNVEKDVRQIIGRYSNKGMKIDLVIFGHIHSTYLGDFFGRSGSLVGQNAYSEYSLNLDGKASQNIYILSGNGNIDGIKIDLQNTEDLTEGYDIERELVDHKVISVKNDLKKNYYKII